MGERRVNRLFDKVDIIKKVLKNCNTCTKRGIKVIIPKYSKKLRPIRHIAEISMKLYDIILVSNHI